MVDGTGPVVISSQKLEFVKGVNRRQDAHTLRDVYRMFPVFHILPYVFELLKFQLSTLISVKHVDHESYCFGVERVLHPAGKLRGIQKSEVVERARKVVHVLIKHFIIHVEMEKNYNIKYTTYELTAD
jgi:hypothetical protein